MGTYQNTIQTVVTGLEDLNRSVQITEKQASATKRVEEGLKSFLAEHDKWVKQSKTQAEEEAKIAALKEKYWDQQTRQLRQLAAAQDAAAKENEKRNNVALKQNEELANSVRNFIQNPLNSASNAAANFAAKYGMIGISGVSVAATLAITTKELIQSTLALGSYAEQVQNTAIRTGMTTTETQLFTRAAEVAGVNANSLTTAMRTLSRGMSENSEEGKKQKRVLAELGLGAEDAFRPMGELLPDILERLGAVGNAMERDRMAITLFGRGGLEILPLAGNLKQLEDQVKATGVIIDKEGIKKLADYEDHARLLGLQWQALKNTLAQKAVGVIEFTTGGNMDLGSFLGGGFLPGGVPAFLFPNVTPRPTVNRTGQEVLDDKREKERQRLHAQFAAQNQSALNAYDLANEDPKVRISRQLREQEDARTAAANRVRGALDIPGREAALQEVSAIDRKIKSLKEEEKALHEVAAAEERVIELSKRAAESSARRLLGKDEFGQAASEQVKLMEDYQDDLRKYGKTPAQRDSITRSYERLFGANLQHKQDAQRNWEHAFEESGLRGDEIVKGMEKTLAEEITKELKKDRIDPLLEAPLPRLAPPPGYVTAQQALRDARDSGRRSLGQFGIRAQISGMDEGQKILQMEALRVQTAEREFQAELRLADKKKTEGEREDARLDALDQKHQKIFDAQMDRENALLEVALKQKESFQSGTVGFFNAIRSGGSGASKFFSGFERSLEDKIVSNLAGMVWPKISGIIPHAAADSTLGKILQGTPFGPDPLKTAAVSLNTAGDKLIIAADQLMGAAGGSGGTSTGGFGGGIGKLIGYGSTASGIAGLTGSGGIFDSGYSSDGTPKYSPENYDDNGVFLGAGGAGGHDPSSVGPGTASGSSSFTVAKGFAYGAAAAAAAYGAYSGFKAGGAQGALQGTSAILGGASAIPGPQQPFVAAAAVITGMVASILGDPKQRRQAQIDRALKYSQYVAPVALNESMSVGGTYLDFDRFGGARSSNLSPVPNVMEPYFDYRHDTVVPGSTGSFFGGSGPRVAPIQLVYAPQISAVDGPSVQRILNDHLPVLGDAMNAAVVGGHAGSFQDRMAGL